MSEIIDIHAREILDSRGTPTVEVDVVLVVDHHIQENHLVHMMFVMNVEVLLLKIFIFKIINKTYFS